MKIKVKWVKPKTRASALKYAAYALRWTNRINKILDDVIARCEADQNAKRSAT